MFPPTHTHGLRLAIAVTIVVATVCAATLALGQGLRDGAMYVGTWADATVWVEVLVGEDARAAVRVRSEPTPHARSVGPHFDIESYATWGAGFLQVEGVTRAWHDDIGAQDGRPAHPPDGPVAVRVDATVRDDRTLDPFGSAVVTLGGGPGSASGGDPVTLRLDAVGTIFHSSALLLDGTLEVVRSAPLFYAEPWRSLDLAGRAWASVPEALSTGLAQRSELPQSVAGSWVDRVSAEVMTLGGSIVSVLFTSDTYTGGAHPNSSTWSVTFLWTGAGWRAAELCEVLGALAVPCPEPELREAVIASLRSQEALWVVQGEVGVDTPWLLDGFTVTAAGLRFDFSPYLVGPYAQGPFVVRVPFGVFAGP